MPELKFSNEEEKSKCARVVRQQRIVERLKKRVRTEAFHAKDKKPCTRKLWAG